MKPVAAEGTFEFGPFRLDSGQRLLLRDGVPVALLPKSFDALAALVKSGGLLEKDALLASVWPNAVVEENSVAKAISDVRRALGEGPKDQKVHHHRTGPGIPVRGNRDPGRRAHALGRGAAFQRSRCRRRQRAPGHRPGRRGDREAQSNPIARRKADRLGAQVCVAGKGPGARRPRAERRLHRRRQHSKVGRSPPLLGAARQRGDGRHVMGRDLRRTHAGHLRGRGLDRLARRGRTCAPPVGRRTAIAVATRDGEPRGVPALPEGAFFLEQADGRGLPSRD